MGKKAKSRFVCQGCGAEHPKSVGRCHYCGEWGTVVEELAEPPARRGSPGEAARALPLADVQLSESERIPSGIGEFDRVIGGGVVPGSTILIGGAPGIGKSTLLLHLAQSLGAATGPILYVSGEESPQQIRLRAERLGVSTAGLYLLPEVNVEVILNRIAELEPTLVFIDSIQTLHCSDIASSPGSVSQVRESASTLIRAGKSAGISIIFVGHVTKDGSIAGPRVLEHLVDTVLYFEGDEYQNFRILKAVKNRFGSTGELGIFEMLSTGLRGVLNPSEFFLSRRKSPVPGSVVVPLIEGTRPFLVEIQSLVTRSWFQIPARRFNGVDANRAALLLAVVEKRGGLRLGNLDVFVNAAGGVQVGEPAADLALVTAVVSALRDRPVLPGTVLLGEVGLGGELRGVTQVERRLKEAQRLGFKRAFIPADNLVEGLQERCGLEITAAEHIGSVLGTAVPPGRGKAERGAGAPEEEESGLSLTRRRTMTRRMRTEERR